MRERRRDSFIPLIASQSQRGFTLIELVMVMVIIGIVGAYAAVRWESGHITSHAQAERLADDFRYIQSLAMGWSEDLWIDVSGTGYAVKCKTGGGACASANDIVTDPMTHSAFSYTLEDSVTLSGTDIYFDKLGRPNNSSAALLSASTSFTLTGGSSTWTVAVAPITGFASISGP